MVFPFFNSKHKKKIFILLGHPFRESLNGYLADEYEAGAREAGHDVRRINIGELKFDPVLWKGYREIQELEPDLLTVQENFKWAEHVVIFYPTWFSTMPGVLKGLFDRMWLPGFAYHFPGHGIGWGRLLKGRSARVFITADSPAWASRLIFGDTTNEIGRGILWFAGFSPVHIKKIAPIKNITDTKRKWWGKRLRSFGFLGS